jgi:hypothetical protein
LDRLREALDAGEDKHLSWADVQELLATNKAQLWQGDGGSLVTQLIDSSDGKCVHCWLGGGDMEALLAMRAGIEAWGRMQGCRFASINGRKGWDRIFRRYGYQRIGGELVKSL